ncbi:MAG: radical SAM protein [Bacillota bacterium]|nr:MAG: radical SAM protein [Bacillota bacterium]
MLDLTALLFDENHYGNSLRYHPEARGARHGTREGTGPVVVWNSTALCNLRCVHCYYGADFDDGSGEAGEKAAPEAHGLTTAQALDFVDSLAGFRVPVLLISGGEPFLRRDLFDVIGRAVSHGMRVTLSTNGTLITPGVAARVKDAGVSYVGISLDGLGDTNDRFRGRDGAFDAALRGIRNCREAGQRMGLRFTLSRHNVEALDSILDLVEREDIPRVCFYHLVPSGRGRGIASSSLSPEETRRAMDLIVDRARDFARRGIRKEILTVDNHADGVYLYLKLLKEDPERAPRVLARIRLSGGNRSGMAIAAVNHRGDVTPDQFTGSRVLGNILERPFPDIWTDSEQPLLKALRDRKTKLTGRCGGCAWLDACNGNLRARAEAATGDFWASDPGCYLTDDEIREVVA